jgi:toxin ParE1/3/4
MNVHWTDTAVAHLTAIHEFISQDSTVYAQRVVDRLTRRSEQIAIFPLSGRTVPEANLPQIREIIEGPYRIIYHIKADQIDVIAVLHAARQTPWTESN